MKYLIIICLTVGICGHALCAECPAGYTQTDAGNCTITCQPGYFVEFPGAKCTKITEGSTYTDAPHTLSYGETSATFLKKCPRSADGSSAYIPDAHMHNSVSFCLTHATNIRMSQQDRYGRNNCNTSDIHSCVWLTHGVGSAACYYTTGTDGAAIYDNQKTDPATGESRRACTGSSALSECDAGYYAPYLHTGDGLQYHPCNPVGTAYWSPDKDLNRYECPAGTATCGFGECADSADDCLPYKRLAMDGHGDILLWQVRRSEKSLAVKYPDGKIYYGMITPVAQAHGLNIAHPDGKTYTVLSPTDSFVPYDSGDNTDILMYDTQE